MFSAPRKRCSYCCTFHENGRLCFGLERALAKPKPSSETLSPHEVVRLERKGIKVPDHLKGAKINIVRR